MRILGGSSILDSWVDPKKYLCIAAGVMVAISIRVDQAYAFSGRQLSAPTIPDSERQSLLHSHNDYEQERPLWDALRVGMDSVEADIWYQEGELRVSHLGIHSKGTLEALYLDPLTEILRTRSSVYGDGRPFYLWIEFKDTSDKVVPALFEVLNRYSFLTVFSDSQIKPGPVTVILTGNFRNKKKFEMNYPIRPAVSDVDRISESDQPARHSWEWYSIAWYDYFKWNGYGLMSYEDELRLELLVRLAHSKGRKLRFYGTPEVETFWNEALVQKVDMIGTDDPARLQSFIRTP